MGKVTHRENCTVKLTFSCLKTEPVKNTFLCGLNSADKTKASGGTLQFLEGFKVVLCRMHIGKCFNKLQAAKIGTFVFNSRENEVIIVHKLYIKYEISLERCN